MVHMFLDYAHYNIPLDFTAMRVIIYDHCVHDDLMF
jgi:hypothetical protein